MKNLFSYLHLRDSLDTLRTRFPLPTLIVLAVTVLLLYVVNTEASDVIYQKFWLTGVVTFFLSIGVVMFRETWKRPPLDKLLGLLPILYGVLFYFTVDIRESMTMQSITYFLLHLTGFLALIFFAPYISRILEGRERSIEYTNYFSRVAWMFLMSIIVGVSLLILGFIAISAVLALFELSKYTWDSKLYGNWAVISLSLVAPLYGLVHMPSLGEIDREKYETNRFFAFLIRYVATPAIFVYFAILYAYSLKVLMNFSDWPKGLVSWLVIGFSSFGYLTYIFSKSYEETAFVRAFRQYFPYVVIPQIGMLAYAIWLRIAQYDLTMNRYFVVIFGLWLAGVSLYYVVSKRKSLAIIPASLSLIALIISLGPWSVFSYPQGRQEARLIRNLEAAKILQNGNIVPLVSERDISKELSTEIAAGIEYLCNFDDCARIREIFPTQVAKAEVKSREDWQSWNKENTGSTFPGASVWDIQSTITKEIRVQRYNYDDVTREFPEQEYLSYNVDYQKGLFPLDVRGYDALLQITSADQKRVYPDKSNYPYVVYDAQSGALSYYSASGVVDIYALTLSEKLLDSATLSLLGPSELTFVLSDDTREIRLILQNLMVKNPRFTDTPSKDLYIEGANGYALIKEKK